MTYIQKIQQRIQEQAEARNLLLEISPNRATSPSAYRMLQAVKKSIKRLLKLEKYAIEKEIENLLLWAQDTDIDPTEGVKLIGKDGEPIYLTGHRHLKYKWVYDLTKANGDTRSGWNHTEEVYSALKYHTNFWDTLEFEPRAKLPYYESWVL